jgi:hypothetical protein
MLLVVAEEQGGQTATDKMKPITITATAVWFEGTCLLAVVTLCLWPEVVGKAGDGAQ